MQELKLEVEPSGVVEIVAQHSPESILPHEGSHSLDYSVNGNSANGNDKDPLESVVRGGPMLVYKISVITLSNNKFHKENIIKVKSILIQNNFPLNIINKRLSYLRYGQNNISNQILDNSEKKFFFIHSAYHKSN